MTIVRSWAAHTTAEHLPAYVKHVRTRVLPVLNQIDGYEGARLLQRPTGDAIEVVVLTRWRSLDAIRRFAGDDLEAAVVEEDAAVLLLDFDPRVKHYDVALEDGD
jgi:heme-degrading monooxygenase HmoA